MCLINFAPSSNLAFILITFDKVLLHFMLLVLHGMIYPNGCSTCVPSCDKVLASLESIDLY